MQEDAKQGMELEIGAILEGKVTGITKFGAFVALPGGRSGLVHISEVAHSYVSDVSEFLSVGDNVNVKVVSVDESNRINLSIKQTLPPPPRPERSGRPRGENRGGRGEVRERRDARPPRSEGRGRPQNSAPRSADSKESNSFDDMLKRFMSESERNNARLNRNEGRRRRGRGN